MSELSRSSRDLAESESDSAKSRDDRLNSLKSGMSIFFRPSHTRTPTTYPSVSAKRLSGGVPWGGGTTPGIRFKNKVSFFSGAAATVRGDKSTFYLFTPRDLIIIHGGRFIRALQKLKGGRFIWSQSFLGLDGLLGRSIHSSNHCLITLNSLFSALHV